MQHSSLVERKAGDSSICSRSYGGQVSKFLPSLPVPGTFHGFLQAAWDAEDSHIFLSARLAKDLGGGLRSDLNSAL